MTVINSTEMRLDYTIILSSLFRGAPGHSYFHADAPSEKSFANSMQMFFANFAILCLFTKVFFAIV